MTSAVTLPVAVVLERNKLVGRRIGRVLGSAGYEVRSFESPEAVDAQARAASLMMGDALDAPALLGMLAAHPGAQAVLYTCEPLDPLLGQALEQPRLVAVVGRPAADQAPREADLLHIARRALTGEGAPLEGHLAWGATGFARAIRTTAEAGRAVTELSAFVARLGAPKKTVDLLGELGHELLMNALYDAPADASGRPRFAHDRKSAVELAAAEAATFRVASDGVRVAVEVADPFGRLERRHVFGGLARALATGQVDTKGGGAGLGMMVAYRATTALFYDVARGRRTRVTGLYDLDLNQRELRQLPRTIHFPEAA